MKNPFAKKTSESKLNLDKAAVPIPPFDTLPAPMTVQRLDALVREASKKVRGQLGYWQFKIGGRDLLVVTDETNNRMRIMSPVARAKGLGADELTRLLEANFSSALDARYALREGMLWSVFTHRLAELTDMQFLCCLAQVTNLADNFGGSYASGNLTFGGS